MSSVFYSMIDCGSELFDLVTELSEWSQKTFGTDAERGPTGPLKHLEKEAREALEKPQDIMEYADILILLLDASRRAGIKPLELLRAARRKMVENRARCWPKPTSDEPVEHIRD